MPLRSYFRSFRHWSYQFQWHGIIRCIEFIAVDFARFILFLILASLLRISFMIQFISRTVITAYVTEASCLIIANQCKHLLGLRNDAGEIPTSFFEIILQTFSSIQFSLCQRSAYPYSAILFLLLQSKFPFATECCYHFDFEFDHCYWA